MQLVRPATLVILLAGAAGCPATPSTNPPSDLAGADLTGVDLTGEPPPPDLSGTGDLRSCTLGTQWDTADQLPAMTGRRTLARRIASDGAGKLWVGGQYSDDMSSAQWLVRSSSDGGATWQSGPSFRYAQGQIGGAPALVRDRKRGNLLLAGWMADSMATEHWLVRRSTDGGASFSTTDDYALNTGKNAAAFGAADDAAGNLYVAGYGFEANDTRHWIVRRSTDGGATWQTGDDFVYAGGTRSEAADIVEIGGAMVAVGFGRDASGPRWLARRSAAGGAGGWTTTDNFQLAAGFDALASGVAAASDGKTVYVAGSATNDKGAAFWIVRKSDDGGMSWRTVDQYRHADNREARAYAVYVDRGGAVYVMGDGLEVTGRYSWVVRRSGDGGATWQGLDTFAGHNSSGAAPRGMGEDPSGAILVAGGSNETLDTARWMVRRLRCQ